MSVALLVVALRVLRAAAAPAASPEAWPPVADRDSSITRGTFLNCWNPALGLTSENCCGRGAPCFDGFYTEARCCGHGPSSGSIGEPAGEGELDLVHCLRDVRADLERCVDEGCDDVGAAACDELIETPFCAEHCRALPGGHSSTVTRSSKLGRALWCLARRPEVRVALDLFLAEGDGSATLLGHGLLEKAGSSPGEQPTVLLGFERDAESYERAVQWFSQVGWAEVLALRIPQGASPSELEGLAERVLLGQSAAGGQVAAMLFQGEPYENAADVHAAKERRHSAVRAVCEKLPVDILFLDPAGTAAEVEFLEVIAFCRPLKWVVVNNANLPGHAGWVREYLLGLGGEWAEVISGHTSDPWGAGKQTWLAELYRSRTWVALARTSALC